MPRAQKDKRFTLILLLALLVSGLTLLAFPVPAQENTGQYATPPNYLTSSVNKVIGYAPAGYFATAHFSSGNTVTVTLSLVESSIELFQATFPAGTFDVPNVSVGTSGGTVFLTIQSANRMITLMNVVARIFHEVTAFPFFWAGVAVLGLAVVFAMATFYKNTSLGRIAARILPVNKLGL